MTYFRSSLPLLPLAKPLAIASLTAIGLALGIVPDLTFRVSGSGFNSTAYAQNITRTELENYARSVLAIENIRQSAYNDIKQIVGSNDTPAISCNKQDSLNKLPDNIQGIAVNYCNQSKKIVESNGLTIARFNAITVKIQEDADLKGQIQAELIRLQKPAPSPTP